MLAVFWNDKCVTLTYALITAHVFFLTAASFQQWLKGQFHQARYYSSVGLTIRAKIIGGERPLLPEILSQSDSVGAKFEQ